MQLKIDKPLARLTKKKDRKLKLSITEMKWAIIADFKIYNKGII